MQIIPYHSHTRQTAWIAAGLFGLVLLIALINRWWKRQSNGWKTPLRKSPSGQARGHRKSLSAYLQTQWELHPGLANLNLAIEPFLVFVGAAGLQTEGLAITAVRAKELVDYVRSLPTRFTPDQVSTIADMFRTMPPDSLKITGTRADAERVPDAGGAPKAEGPGWNGNHTTCGESVVPQVWGAYDLANCTKRAERGRSVLRLFQLSEMQAYPSGVRHSRQLRKPKHAC